MKTPAVSRRAFIRWGSATGVALVVGLDSAERLVSLSPTTSAPAPFEPNQWIRIDDTGAVTIVSAYMEMGQGIRTAVPMMLADELGADWNRVTVVHASPGPRHPDMRTSGSSSVADAWSMLRTVGAAAREMLIAAAAAEWGVDHSSCAAANGVVTHRPSGRQLQFGALVGRAAALPVPASPRLRSRDEQTIVGTRVRRVDGRDIVTGRAQFGLDVRVPGLRFAAIARPPQYGARVRNWNADAARAIGGVREAFEIPTGVVVIADKTWTALKARDALRLEWAERPAAGLDSAAYVASLRAGLPRGKPVGQHGNFSTALQRAARTLTATYSAPFQPHAAMEPLNCIAEVRDGRCEIWVGTQAPNEAQKEVATLLAIDPERVTLHPQLIGGSFGRRLTNDFILEAVEVARRTRGPVQVVWSRGDDFHHDTYQPAQVNRLTAGLDASGNPIAWRHETADYHLTTYGAYDPNYSADGNPWGVYDTPYEFAGFEATYSLLEAPVPTGAWRSVAYPAAVFARESFLDEVARAGGHDPVALRLSLIPSPGNIVRGGVTRANGDRLRGVVRLAAERAGWSRPFARERSGRRWGRGIACNAYHGATMVAQVAEVSVGPSNDIRVHRVVSAVDCGLAINPLGIEGQFESGVIWALSSVLNGMTFGGGRAIPSNFDEYHVVRMREAPVIETHIVDSSVRPLGVGEQPVPAVWPAVANAVFAATGRRVRDLPLALR